MRPQRVAWSLVDACVFDSWLLGGAVSAARSFCAGTSRLPVTLDIMTHQIKGLSVAA